MQIICFSRGGIKMAKIVNEVPENWREELATFSQTDEGKEFFNTSIRRPDGNLGMKPIPMIEYGKIVEIIEFIFADDKLYSALEEYCIYQNQVEEADHVHATDADFAHIKMPVEARDEIFDFYKWYAMKSLTGYGRGQTSVILNVACRTFMKTFPNIRSVDAIEFIKSTYPKFISF